MSLSDVELAHVATELSSSLLGASVARVRQRDELTFLLTTRDHDLLVCARPRVARVHLIPHDKPSEPPPSPFALSLRKELRAGRLVSVTATPGDRILTLDFGSIRLIAELSTLPNLILVAPDDSIVAALHPSAGKRTLLAGQPYQPLLADPAAPAASWRGRDRFGAPPGTSARIAAAYSVLEEELERTTLLRSLASTVDRARTRTTRLIAALASDRARAEAAQLYRKYGDLLLAHLHEVPRGAASVTLPDDFTDGSPLDIPLDPARAPRDNAARFYQQHKKMAGSLVTIDQRLAQAHARAAHLDHLAGKLAAPEVRDDLEALRALARTVETTLPAAPPRSAREQRDVRERAALPYHEFISAAGDTILVGKGARQNDELTFRHARGNDLWLHAREVPGSHVIVRLGAGRGIVEATLLDAATLAAHYSQARTALESGVDISYTYRKHVRRAGRDAPGLVTMASAKTIRIRLDADRLARLLAQRPAAKP